MLAGIYVNEDVAFSFKVVLRENRLALSFKGIDAETYELRHYQYDTYTWWISHNESAKRGRIVLHIRPIIS
jgi:hypothetical protein